MKELLLEIKRTCDFCFQCPYYDYYNSPEYKERQNKPRRSGYISLDVSTSAIIKSVLGASSGESSTLVEEPEEVDEIKEMLEFVNYKPQLTCPKLRDANLDINIYRELEMPANEAEALKILDKFDNLLFPHCPFTNKWHEGDKSNRGRATIALAKLDFELMTKGIDMLELCESIGLYLDYYDRDEHITQCGYSWSLIRKFQNKLHQTSSERPLSAGPLITEFQDEPHPQTIPVEKTHKTPYQYRDLDIFSSDYAMELLKRLTDAGYCNDDYRWIDTSQKTLMCQAAHIIGGLLDINIRHKWKPFEGLWEVKGLAQAYHKRESRPLDKEMRELYPEYHNF